MIDEKLAILNAVKILDERGFGEREFINAEFFDGKQPDLPFLEERAPHFIVRFKNLAIEKDCVVDDGNSLLCVEVDSESGKSRFLAAFD